MSKETQCTEKILTSTIKKGDQYWDIWDKNTNKTHRGSKFQGYNNKLCGYGNFKSNGTRYNNNKYRWQNYEFNNVQQNCIRQCKNTQNCGAVSYASRNNWWSYSPAYKTECSFRKIHNPDSHPLIPKKMYPREYPYYHKQLNKRFIPHNSVEYPQCIHEPNPGIAGRGWNKIIITDASLITQQMAAASVLRTTGNTQWDKQPCKDYHKILYPWFKWWSCRILVPNCWWHSTWWGGYPKCAAYWKTIDRCFTTWWYTYEPLTPWPLGDWKNVSACKRYEFLPWVQYMKTCHDESYSMYLDFNKKNNITRKKIIKLFEDNTQHKTPSLRYEEFNNIKNEIEQRDQEYIILYHAGNGKAGKIKLDKIYKFCESDPDITERTVGNITNIKKIWKYLREYIEHYVKVFNFEKQLEIKINSLYSKIVQKMNIIQTYVTDNNKDLDKEIIELQQIQQEIELVLDKCLYPPGRKTEKDFIKIHVGTNNNDLFSNPNSSKVFLRSTIKFTKDVLLPSNTNSNTKQSIKQNKTNLLMPEITNTKNHDDFNLDNIIDTNRFANKKIIPHIHTSILEKIIKLCIIRQHSITDQNSINEWIKDGWTFLNNNGIITAGKDQHVGRTKVKEDGTSFDGTILEHPESITPITHFTNYNTPERIELYNNYERKGVNLQATGTYTCTDNSSKSDNFDSLGIMNNISNSEGTSYDCVNSGQIKCSKRHGFVKQKNDHWENRYCDFENNFFPGSIRRNGEKIIHYTCCKDYSALYFDLIKMIQNKIKLTQYGNIIHTDIDGKVLTIDSTNRLIFAKNVLFKKIYKHSNNYYSTSDTEVSGVTLGNLGTKINDKTLIDHIRNGLFLKDPKYAQLRDEINSQMFMIENVIKGNNPYFRIKHVDYEHTSNLEKDIYIRLGDTPTTGNNYLEKDIQTIKEENGLDLPHKFYISQSSSNNNIRPPNEEEVPPNTLGINMLRGGETQPFSYTFTHKRNGIDETVTAIKLKNLVILDKDGHISTNRNGEKQTLTNDNYLTEFQNYIEKILDYNKAFKYYKQLHTLYFKLQNNQFKLQTQIYQTESLFVEDLYDIKQTIGPGLEQQTEILKLSTELALTKAAEQQEIINKYKEEKQKNNHKSHKKIKQNYKWGNGFLYVKSVLLILTAVLIGFYGFTTISNGTISKLPTIFLLVGFIFLFIIFSFI